MKLEQQISDTYLPLNHHLMILLQIPGMLESISTYQDSSCEKYAKTQIVSNIMQGSLWRQKYKPLFRERIVIPLFGFFDDLETSNAMGSHSRGQKFGTVYVSLPTLSIHLRSKLDNTLVSTIFHSNDRKEFSNKQVFRKFIDDINSLTNNGINLKIGEEQVEVYFQLVMILGDN